VIIKIGKRGNVGVLSVDLHVKRLFEQRTERAVLEISEVCEDGAEEDLFKEIHPKKDRWNLNPNRLYLAEAHETLEKCDGIAADMK